MGVGVFPRPFFNHFAMGVQKRYDALTEISLNLRVGGGRKHVSFVPRTNGSSYYVTCDESVQSALERHHWFGNRFSLRVDDAPSVCVNSPSVSGEEVSNGGNGGMSVVDVRCWSDAKDYLVEHYGVSRTKVRVQSSIISFAASVGIEFRFVQ